VAKVKEAEHLRRLVLYEQGLSDHQIAEILDSSVGAIKNWRNQNGLDRNVKPDINSKKWLYQR